MKSVILVIILLTAFLAVVTWSFWLGRVSDDSYCRTIPMDRIDRERCGLNK